MPITASCGNCGKSYQAPDRLAGKTVRCKECGEMFRIDAADVEAGEPDLDALERSFADESLATGGATAIGGTAGGRAAIDAHGRARIERGEGVDGLGVRGEAGSNLLRSNFRYRYPGAKQVDQLLPWALVALAGVVLSRACLNSYASGEQEPPSQGVGFSRLAILLAAYLFVIWPAAHVALMMATTRLRMSLPRAAAWRSFAAFTPVLMLGGGLYVFSGGDAVGLVMGLFVGATVACGAVALLFRMFPNEVPTAASYAAVGSVGGAVVASGLIFLINLIGASLARLDKSPTLFTSPIAIGLPWVERPAPVPLVVAKRPPVTTNNSKPADPPAKSNAEPAGESALQSLPVPRPEGDGVAALVARVEITPVPVGFDEVIVTPVASKALGVIRSAAGGAVEVWDASTWKQPTPLRGRGFDRGSDALAINTTARTIWHLVHSPADRLEQIALGNTAVKPSVDVLGGTGARRLFGFVNEHEVLMRVDAENGIGFERYDVENGVPVGDTVRLGLAENAPFQVEPSSNAVRLLPDASALLVVGLDPSGGSQPVALALYPAATMRGPTAVRRLRWNDTRNFRPAGLAVTNAARVALLLDSAGAAYLTVWDMRPTQDASLSAGPREKPTLDRKLGLLISELIPPSWSPDVDPLLWIDDSTLLVCGNQLIDAGTGITLGTLGIDNVSAQYPGAHGTVLLVQRRDGLNTLLQITLDAAAIAAKRK